MICGAEAMTNDSAKMGDCRLAGLETDKRLFFLPGKMNGPL
jgi:hypothetical protein